MKLCWFTTGRDREAFTLLEEVVDAIEGGVIEGSIAAVFMNRERGESAPSDEIIAYVEKKGLPLVNFSSKRFLAERKLSLAEGRELFDREVKQRIAPFDFDAIFLAGYMLILSRVLHESYPVLNLHPSLPGAYKGKWEDVIRDTIKDGERSFGAMVHMAEAVLDEGAPVAYVKLSLEGPEIDELYRRSSAGDRAAEDQLFALMREREFAAETPLIVKTLALLSKGSIRIDGSRVLFGGKPVEGGVDITSEVLG